MQAKEDTFKKTNPKMYSLNNFKNINMHTARVHL